MEANSYILKETIVSIFKSSSAPYGFAGDKVKLISTRGHVVILEGMKGGRIGPVT